MKRRSSPGFRSKSFARAAPLPFIGGRLGGAVFVLTAIVFLILSALNPGGISGMRMAATDVMAPALSAVSKPLQDAALLVRNISGLAELQAENARLTQENMRLREWYQTALMLEAQNKSLAELLNVKPEPQSRYITARIIADSGNAFVKSLLVLAGREDGVKKGQAVVSGDGVIGRVIEVGNKTARILLITDINSRVPILVEDSRQHAVLAGNNNDQMTLIHLPPDSEVSQGARIVTSGHGGVFPPGMPLGRVVVDEDGSRKVEPFADFHKMVYVRIVDRPEDPNLVRGSLE